MAEFINENLDRNAFALAVVLYGISSIYSVFLWRKGFRRDDHINYLLLLLGFCAQFDIADILVS